MTFNKVCGNCVHYPLCYGMWHVDATHPCRHIVGASLGFFRPKSKVVDEGAENSALLDVIAELKDALQFCLVETDRIEEPLNDEGYTVKWGTNADVALSSICDRATRALDYKET